MIDPRPTLESYLTAVWRREYQRAHTRFHATTSDGVLLRGVHFHAGHETLLIYCHGFSANKNFVAVPRFVEMLAEEMDALAFDFRGHGESDGATTLGEREILDLEAIVDYARGFGYRHIFLVGSSMGGATAIRYAAQSSTVDGVATIGAYAHGGFSPIAAHAVKLFRLPLTHAVVRAARQCRVESVTLHSTPLDVVHRLSPRPLLLIHGALDPLIPVRHARELYARAGEPKKLIVIPRGSHDIPNLNRRTRDWIVDWFREGDGNN